MFTWDAANIAHIARHKVLPQEVEQVVANRPLDLGRQLRNGERRRMHVGETDKGRILVIVLTDDADGAIRTVTAHPAKLKMRRFYTTQKANRYAEDS